VARETGTVPIDGRDLGQAPIAGGSPAVALTAPDGRHPTRQVTVRPDGGGLDVSQ
jgi:hypothetical protein